MSDEAIFKLASKFKNADLIQFYETIKKIPANAFHPVNGYQDKLKRVCFFYPDLSSIGSNAFSAFNNLNDINFLKSNIKSIEKNAFTFEKYSDQKLMIEFQDCVIDGTVFGNNFFDGLKRPTNLILNNTVQPNMVKHLNEKAFLTFLSENGHNTITLVNNLLDCNDCRNAWLREQQELQSRVNPIKCLDGKDFNDFKNFKNC